MSDLVEHGETKRGSNRGFGLVFTAAFALIGAAPLIHGGEPRLWAFGVAAAFLIVALVYPRALAPLNFLWFKFGLLLGAVIAPLVMGAVFFLGVLPTGLALRLTGKDPMRRAFEPKADSYWIARDKSKPMGSMKNQF